MEGVTNDQNKNSEIYLALHITLLEIAGMWPVRKFNKLWPNHIASFCLFISISCQVVVLLAEQGYLIQPSTKPLDAVSYIGTACLRIEAISKLVYMLIIRKRIGHLLESLELCFRLSTGDEDKMPYNNGNVKSIMTAWSRRAMMMALGWVGLCVFGGIQWALVPFGINTDVTVTAENYDDQQLGNLTANTSTELSLVLEKLTLRELPLRGWFPFNTTISPAYEVVFLIQGIGNISSALAVGVFDQFYCAILLTLCGQFECLKMSLRNITTRINPRNDRQNISTTDSDVTLHDEGTREVRRNRHDERVALNCLHDNLDRTNNKENQYRGYNVIPDPGDSIQHPSGNENDSSLCIYRNKIEDELKSCIRHHQSLIKYAFCIRSYLHNV
jgi:hypothetical protein